MTISQPASQKTSANSNAPSQQQCKLEKERRELLNRVKDIKHKIMVFSGKGGVGKSTVAASLAFALHEAGKRVGLLDIDIHGPSIPKMLGLEGHSVSGTESSIVPVEILEGFKVMSIGFLLRNLDDAVIWRGPMKYNMIKQFLKDVEWGTLDYLIIDSPPGTGDESLAAAQLLEDADGAIVVTTPQQVAISDVRKCINFCRHVNLPVLGVLENMSGFICPHCNKEIDVFKTGGGKEMANQMNVPFFGSIPIDPKIVTAGDNGTFIKNSIDAKTYNAFMNLVRSITEPNPGNSK